MDLSPEHPAIPLEPVAMEALNWVVRRLDAQTWTSADAAELHEWRKADPENERQFVRHELVAQLISRPQAHRDAVLSRPAARSPAPAPETDASQATHSVRIAAEAADYLAQASRPQVTAAEGVALLTEAIVRLQSLLISERPTHRLRLAHALIRRGNARRQSDPKQQIDEILKDYDAAETQLILLLPDQNPSWRDDLAEVCTQRGVALLQCATPASLRQAVTCFDRAIEIRRPLQSGGDPWSIYSLAATWMNRGDALFRTGERMALDQALEAYDQAFALLRDTPFADHPAFSRRFVVASLNRCGILLERNAAGDAVAGVRCCDEALARLPATTDEMPAEIILRASVWANRAAACARLHTSEAVSQVREASRKAVALVQALERDEPHAAYAGIIARHAWCVAATTLVTSEIDGHFRAALVAEAMTAVNGGLNVARSWEFRGHQRFQAQATELFRFGGRLSEQYQPHLLGEFFLSHLDPRHTPEGKAWRPELYQAAVHALEQAIEKMLIERIKPGITTELSDYFLDALNAMRQVHATMCEHTGYIVKSRN